MNAERLEHARTFCLSTPALSACAHIPVNRVHTPSSPDRERGRERKRARGSEGEREREKESERE